MEAAEGRTSTVPTSTEEVVSPRALVAAVGRPTAADPSRVTLDRRTRPVQVLAASGEVSVLARRRRRPPSTRPILPREVA